MQKRRRLRWGTNLNVYSSRERRAKAFDVIHIAACVAGAPTIMGFQETII